MNYLHLLLKYLIIELLILIKFVLRLNLILLLADRGDNQIDKVVIGLFWILFWYSFPDQYNEEN